MIRCKLIDELISSVAANDRKVIDARVGVTWTAVYGMNCGLAKTYGIPVKHGNYTKNMGSLTEMSTLDMPSTRNHGILSKRVWDVRRSRQ